MLCWLVLRVPLGEPQAGYVCKSVLAPGVKTSGVFVFVVFLGKVLAANLQAALSWRGICPTADCGNDGLGQSTF